MRKIATGQMVLLLGLYSSAVDLEDQAEEKALAEDNKSWTLHLRGDRLTLSPGSGRRRRRCLAEASASEEEDAELALAEDLELDEDGRRTFCRRACRRRRRAARWKAAKARHAKEKAQRAADRRAGRRPRPYSNAAKPLPYGRPSARTRRRC